MNIIGLTGGIGSGKSTVAAVLTELGATVIHADTVGHGVYRPDTDGWRRVIDTFGKDILAPDRTIDRKKLGAIVFSSPAALKHLNAIVHPLILAEVRHQIEAHRQTGSVLPLVVEAAILIEANWLPLVDEVWLVVAERHAVEQRIATQRNLSATDVGARLNAQLSDAERRRFADVVIENAGSIDELRARVIAAWSASTARP